MSVKAIEVVNLSKRYQENNLVLNQVSFTVPQGSFFALLGLNGAGKSTLISILSCLTRADSGSIAVMGFDCQRQSLEARHCLGLMPQEINLHPFITVADVLNNHVGYYGLSAHKMRDWIDHILERLDLMGKKHTQICRLSGGMKRRVLLARTLSTRPLVALLDEPTAGVDINLKDEIYELLREINRSGTTIILTTHYLEEADNLCSDYALLAHGQIVSQGLMTDMRGVTPFSLVLNFRVLPDLLELPKGVTQNRPLQWDVVAPLTGLVDVFSFIQKHSLELVHLELKSQLESYFKTQTNLTMGDEL